jgi:hypothetical protein
MNWMLDKPSEWLAACTDSTIKREFESLSKLVANTDPIFHSLWIRRRAMWRDKPLDETILAGKLAMKLVPNIAEGRPLRGLSIDGIDTKFFERNATLLTLLLDIRFDGEASRIGLEVFLGAVQAGEHWLLVIDLDGGSLPFQKLRVRSTELINVGIACRNLLIVENESCQHLLPRIEGGIAILGSGFDLQWLQGEWIKSVNIAYWGDIDTWGLQFLSDARKHCPDLTPLLMSNEVFEKHKTAAVPEPLTASSECPSQLTDEEAVLYRRLLRETHGRLEQEFLPIELVQKAIISWANED